MLDKALLWDENRNQIEPRKVKVKEKKYKTYNSWDMSNL